MFLHLGSDFIVNTKDIVGIFDLDNTAINNKTGNFLKIAEENGIVVTIDNDLPKSFIIATIYNEIRVYLSSLSCSTLKKRIEKS